MKRFSIGLLMAVVFLIAVDFALLRELWKIPGSAAAMGVITLPTINLLILLTRRTRGDRGARRFWIGFEAAGWVVTVLFASCTWFFPETFLAPLTWLGDGMGPGPLSLATLVFLFAFAVVFYTIPQLMVATAGGLFASGYRVALVIKRPPPAAIDPVCKPFFLAEDR